MSSAEMAERLEKVLELWAGVMAVHGDWDDGCFYYCKRSASELQEPMQQTWAVLRDIAAARTKQRRQDRKLAKAASAAMKEDMYGEAND